MKKCKKYAKKLSSWTKVICPYCETVNWIKFYKDKASFCCHKCDKLSWIDENYYMTYKLIFNNYIEDYCQYGLGFPRD